MSEKFTVLIMSSTHWDREWYEPFQGFRYRANGNAVLHHYVHVYVNSIARSCHFDTATAFTLIK